MTELKKKAIQNLFTPLLRFAHTNGLTQPIIDTKKRKDPSMRAKKWWIIFIHTFFVYRFFLTQAEDLLALTTSVKEGVLGRESWYNRDRKVWNVLGYIRLLFASPNTN